MSSRIPVAISFTGVANFLGILGIIGSLIIEALEATPNQQIAQISAYQALTEPIAAYNRVLLTEAKINRVRVTALNNQDLSDSEEELYLAFWRMLLRQAELAFLQYENAIIDEELLLKTLAPLADHLMRSERYARSYWKAMLKRRQESWGYPPAFEVYINEKYLSDNE